MTNNNNNNNNSIDIVGNRDILINPTSKINWRLTLPTYRFGITTGKGRIEVFDN
jgi:hypothetical protein